MCIEKDFDCLMTASDRFAREIAQWADGVGTSCTRQEMADCTLLRRFATAIGEDLADEDKDAPNLGHWALFKDDSWACHLTSDGHATNPVGVVPKIMLPNRMLLAASIEFVRPLRIGQMAESRLTLKDIRQRNGLSGPLLLVDTERKISQSGELVLSETQTMAYLANRRSVSAKSSIAAKSDQRDEVWTPTTVELFRFSAVTFNAHRIHYDLAYACKVEGYPALVVQGPLTAARLLAYARRNEKRCLQHFSYRATAPLFVDRQVRLARGDAEGMVLAIRDDGAVAMTATASFG